MRETQPTVFGSVIYGLRTSKLHENQSEPNNTGNTPVWSTCGKGHLEFTVVGCGEIDFTVEKPRLFIWLIRSVRDRDGMSIAWR